MNECCHGTLGCEGQGEKHMCPPNNVHPAMKMAAGAIRAEERAKIPDGPRREAIYTFEGVGGAGGGPGPMQAAKPVHDSVNHPSHYTSSPAKCSACGHPIECIDVVENMGFNIGNATKYAWRAGKKGDAITDLRKSIWYLQREIANLEKDKGV
jgi:hypothetical protein